MDKNDTIIIKISKIAQKNKKKSGITDNNNNIFHIIIKKKIMPKANNRNLIKRRIRKIIRENIKNNLFLFYKMSKILIFYNISDILEFSEIKNILSTKF